VLQDLLEFAQLETYAVRGLIRSPLLGPKGNAEFLAHLVFPADASKTLDEIIQDVVPISERNTDAHIV